MDENSFYVIKNEPGIGKIYEATIKGPPPKQNTDGMHRPYPGLYLDQAFTEDYATEFMVRVGSDLSPSTLGPYQANPWLSLSSLFDQSPKLGDKTYNPAVMVNLVGSQGDYRLQTFSNGDKGGTYYTNNQGAPLFPLDKWVRIRVDVDLQNKTVKTFQDSILVSEGPYVAPQLRLAGFHWGAYANSKISRATVSNANIVVAPLKDELR